MYTGGVGPLCECTMECALEVQLSGTACLTKKPLTKKPLQYYIIWRLLQVAGVFYKKSAIFLFAVLPDFIFLCCWNLVVL